jgi:Flp pilus assembly protein TadG
VNISTSEKVATKVKWKITRNFLKLQNGGIAVEFVLLVPLILMVLVLIGDFGSYLLKKQSLSSVTRSVITVVSNSPNFAINQPALLSMAQNSLGPSATNVVLNVTSTCSCNGAQTNCANTCNGNPSRMEVQANLSYDHALMFPYPGLGQTLQISDNLVFRIR